MKLSILICSLFKREDQRNELLKSLFEQVKERPKQNLNHLGNTWLYRYEFSDFEILVAIDNKEMKVGAKRNFLVNQAHGEYVCFIDDDDSVSNEYIKTLLFSTQFEYDCVCFHVMYNPTNGSPKLVIYSSRLKDRETPECFERAVNHLMLIKRNIVQRVKFKAINCGEDAIFAKRVSMHIKKEGRIDKVLYSYNFDPLKTETQK